MYVDRRPRPVQSLLLAEAGNTLSAAVSVEYAHRLYVQGSGRRHSAWLALYVCCGQAVSWLARGRSWMHDGCANTVSNTHTRAHSHARILLCILLSSQVHAHLANISTSTPAKEQGLREEVLRTRAWVTELQYPWP